MPRMSVPRERIAELCQQYGSVMNGVLPKDIDGAQLLWALAGNESSYGDNCSPRHEPGYCYITHGGYSKNPSIVEMTEDWGCLAHCSLGPWQLMADNILGFTPMEILCDPEKACLATVGFLKRAVLPMAQSLDDIGHFYNAGPRGPFPTQYVTNLKLHYQVAMPQPAAGVTE